MKGITELSSFMFTARNVADDTHRRGDRHVALEAICRCRASVNTLFRPCLLFKYLSVRVAYDISLTTCRLSMNAPLSVKHIREYLERDTVAVAS